MPIVKNLHSVSGFIDVPMKEDDTDIFSNPIITASRIQKLETTAADEILLKQDVTSWRSTNKQQDNDNCSHYTSTSSRVSSSKKYINRIVEDDEKSASTIFSLTQQQQCQNSASHISFNDVDLVKANEDGSNDEDDDIDYDDIATYLTKGSVKSLPQQPNDVLNSDSDEIATLKDNLRRVQSEAEWYKSKYKQLHLDYNDLQSYCEVLSKEVVKIRNEKNEILLQQRSDKNNNSSSSHHKNTSDDASSSNSTGNSLTSSRLRQNWLFQKLSKITNNNQKNKWTEPQKFQEWDNDTYTTQYTESNRTSGGFFGIGGHSSNNTIPENQQPDNSFSTPTNIIISTPNPSEGEHNNNNVVVEVPYEVPPSCGASSEQNVPSSRRLSSDTHRCKPRRLSIMNTGRRDSMSSVVMNDFQELNLNDSTSQIIFDAVLDAKSPTPSVVESDDDDDDEGENESSTSNASAAGQDDFEIGLKIGPTLAALNRRSSGLKKEESLLVDWSHSSDDDEDENKDAFHNDESYGSQSSLSTSILMEMPQDLSAFNVDR
mmetsp:Transcript_34482/g.38109  ORF Transcript_34482/g.38109 Transcript_34482/m.38109 type:complete len:543 (+) Transcript_34482:285-1913(+)